MSPTTKKFLILGAGAVVGYILYKKITAPATATKTALPVISPVLAAKIAATSRYSRLTPQTTEPVLTKRSPTTTQGNDILADLGLSEELGSLGRAYR